LATQWVYRSTNHLLLKPCSIASNKILQAEDALTHVHGFDFTLKGILPVWEGFEPLQRLQVEPPKGPSQWQAAYPRARRGTASALSATAPRNLQDKKFGNYLMAIEWLNNRNTLSRVEPMGLPKSSKKLAQRQLGLSLVGWNYSDNELEAEITKYVGWRCHLHSLTEGSGGRGNIVVQVERHVGQCSWARQIKPSISLVGAEVDTHRMRVPDIEAGFRRKSSTTLGSFARRVSSTALRRNFRLGPMERPLSDTGRPP
jgi:hypothetical protein